MSPTSYLTAPPRGDPLWTSDCTGALSDGQPPPDRSLCLRPRQVAVTTPSPSASSANARSASTAIFAVVFVVLGLPDFAHGVAWPDMRADFDRPLAALGTFLVVAAAGYLLVAVSTGRLAGRWGLEGLVLRSTLSSRSVC